MANNEEFGNQQAGGGSEGPGQTSAGENAAAAQKIMRVSREEFLARARKSLIGKAVESGNGVASKENASDASRTNGKPPASAPQPRPLDREESWGFQDPPEKFIFKTVGEGMAAFNKRFAYVRQNNLIVRLEDLRVFEPQKWASIQYGNYYYEQKKKNGEVELNQLARHWLGSPHRRQLDTMTFAPGKPPIFENKLNRWKCWGSKPQRGSTEPWAALLLHLFPNRKERLWFLQWLAYPIQHPGAKLTTSVVLIGREGVGKNSLLIPIERIYGQYAINITEAELYADFCPWKKDKQFVVGNEVGGERDKRQVMDKLKDLITSPTMIVNEKFVPQYELPNCANFAFTTNHPDPFYVTDNDRRFWVWQIPQDKPLPPEFFEQFYAWADQPENINALHYNLFHGPLSGFNPKAPAPMTEAKQDVIEIGRTRLETWLREKKEGDKNLYTIAELVKEWKGHNLNAKEGESAVFRTLKTLGGLQANNAKQVKVKGEQLRLWILTSSDDERDRLLALCPRELAAEFMGERPDQYPVTAETAVSGNICN